MVLNIENAKKILKDLEEANQHSEYMCFLAECTDDKHFIEVFKHIKALHELEHHMPNGLNEYRYSKYCELRKIHEIARELEK